MDKEDLNDTFLEMIKDVYYAEKQIVKALPKMIETASYEDLKEAFRHHLGQTKEQVRRLESVFKLLGESPKEKTCHGMKGLIKEGEEVMDMDFLSHALRDACLIIAAQKIEHYEIATYGGLCALVAHLSRALKNNKFVKIQQLLHETLEEEKQTDVKLTKLAEGTKHMQGINEEAEKEIAECCSTK
jgi:ferritin-like metal-binding protein YciE